MLVYDKVDIPICQGLVRGDVIGEFFDVYFEAVLFCFFGSGFNDFSVGACSCTDSDFFLFLRSSGCRRSCRFLAGTAAGNECCCGECAKAGDC